MQTLHAHACDRGLGDHLIGIGGGFHGHIYEGFPCSDRSSADCGESCAHCHAHTLNDRTELFKLSPGGVCLLCGILDFIAKFIRLLCGIRRLVSHAVDSFLVILQLPLHSIEFRFGIIQRHDPLLGAAIILAEGIRSVFERGAQSFDFAFLGVDLLCKDFVPGSQRFNAFLVFVELRGGEFHFRAEDFELLIDVSQSLFELFLTLDADFQAKIVCHFSPPPHIPAGMISSMKYSRRGFAIPLHCL